MIWATFITKSSNTCFVITNEIPDIRPSILKRRISLKLLASIPRVEEQRSRESQRIKVVPAKGPQLNKELQARELLIVRFNPKRESTSERPGFFTMSHIVWRPVVWTWLAYRTTMMVLFYRVPLTTKPLLRAAKRDDNMVRVVSVDYDNADESDINVRDYLPNKDKIRNHRGVVKCFNRSLPV